MSDGALVARDLRCNDLSDPLGVDTRRPHLSWVGEAPDERSASGQRQTAYRIVATDSELVWNSGWMASDRSIQIPWDGPPLVSRRRVRWKVALRDSRGAEGAWSDEAVFEMGLLDPGDWSARWISANTKARETPAVDQPAPYLRDTFDLDGEPGQARVYVSGLGWYELHVNGRRVGGEERLAPAFTRYDVRALYQVHDVTGLLHRGRNALGMILGNGWYNHQVADVWDFKQAPWRDEPKCIVQLEVRMPDGSLRVATTHPGWKWAHGPIRFDALRNGEHYDARLERPGWSTAGFDAAGWSTVRLATSPGGVLSSQQMTPIRVTGTLRPVRLDEVARGIWVADMGRNLTGWARIRPRAEPGRVITLRYAEKIKETGDIDVGNIDSMVKSGEFQTDRYTAGAGAGASSAGEEWEPRFTYHGFRYVQVRGWPGTPRPEDVEGRVVHTDFEDRGMFACSNDLLNAIHEAGRLSTLSNYHGFPTDCPHREKNGWTGDAHLSAEQALFNFDIDTAYRKWMRDFRDVQRPSGQLPAIVPTGGWGFAFGSGPAWDSAALLIPWYLYLYRGDVEILREHWACMCAYVDFLGTMEDDGIVDFGLGDWCPPDWKPSVVWEPTYRCPTAVTDTAYYAVDARILAAVARLTGRDKDADRYGRLAARIREAFRRRFLGTDGTVAGDCQASQACALYQGMVDPGAETERVLARLVAMVEGNGRRIDTGILGAKYVLHTLSDHGRTDLAYALVAHTDFPGWGYMIAQGATTLWETWAGDCSRNHHMFSDVSAWYYRALAGIRPDPDQPGFRRFVVRPSPVADLSWVRARHRSPYGWIEVSWERVGERLVLDLTVPAGATAAVDLPGARTREAAAGRHRLEGRVGEG